MLNKLNLEEKLIQYIISGKEISLERALLIISGLETEKEIVEYVKKLDKIQKNFKEYLIKNLNLVESPISKAKLLFDFLWETKPNRCCDNFLLTQVVDAQLSEDKNQNVGNCLGLTSLYSVLGSREGLDLSILFNFNSNESHIFSRLIWGNRTINIENIKYFFDSPVEEAIELSLYQLIPITLGDRGNAKGKIGDLNGAIEDYNKAIQLNLDKSVCFLYYFNRGNVKHKLADLKGAIEDYNKTIQLNPEFSQAYCNRGYVKRLCGDIKGAIRDYERALKLNPKDNLAYENLIFAKKKLNIKTFKKDIN